MKTLIVVVGLLTVVGLSHGQCSPFEFMCENGRCVPYYYICNGDDNCGDGSDEGLESGICPKCPSGYFKCDNGRCITGDYACDMFRHCTDGSDETEANCVCKDNEIRCSMPPGSPVAGLCIPPEWICDEDDIWDCPFGDDEANCTRSARKTQESQTYTLKET